MPSDDVQPDGITFIIPAGKIKDVLTVFNTGQPNPDGEDTSFRYRIDHQPIQAGMIPPQASSTVQVNLEKFEIDNLGPSVLRLTYVASAASRRAKRTSRKSEPAAR